MQSVEHDARVRVLPAAAYRRVRWKNGAGWTREILRVPDRDDWDWRLSIAEIEHDAPFSSFQGVERELVLLTGEGLRLRFDNGEVHELLQPHASHRFAGERELIGELVNGPTTDFNLMWRRGVVETQLWHRPLVGTMVLFVDAGETWVVHQLTGQARFADSFRAPTLQAGDTALLDAASGRARALLEGGGDLLLVKISPVRDAAAVRPDGDRPVVGQ